MFATCLRAQEDYWQLQHAVWLAYGVSACMILGVMLYAKLFWLDNMHDLTGDQGNLYYRLVLAGIILVIGPASLMGAAIFAGELRAVRFPLRDRFTVAESRP